jgi:uncharacterized protein YndB with AHSA1/START domain
MAAGKVTVHIDAPPEHVYDLISDVTRMGEWSPECFKCVWQGGATGPVVGASFKGSNRQGLFRWTTTAEVVDAERGKAFAFTVKNGQRELTRWRYAFDGTDGGTDVTESYEAVHVPLYVRAFERVFMRNRDGQLEQGMRRTLERVKAVAETGTGA